MKDKSKRIEQMKLSQEANKEAAAAWTRVQNSMKNSKPAANERFKKV